ncbi:MAG: BrnT family toxin [Halobacteriales archaeon]|nr:BrnT family toxin [Halobacteriales archaeon]
MYTHYQEEFEWDRRKAVANMGRHGVAFPDAVEVFFDERALTIPDEHPVEDRFVTVGADALGRTLVVVYCRREERIRIISARRATTHERRQYEGEL